MIEALHLFSTLVLGLFAGSLFMEAMILVPYWRRMQAAEFFRLHKTLGPNLFQYFAPLTSVAVLLNVIIAIMLGASNVPQLISAILCLLALAVFFIYFRAANNRFAEHSLAEDALCDELLKWSVWHWLRTIFIIIALGASIVSHSV